MEEMDIKKMIKELNAGDYAKARGTLQGIVEDKLQQRIKDAMDED